MTRRGRTLLALAAAAYACAWIFGSRPLAVAAVGVSAVLALSWVSVRLASGGVRIRRSVPARRLLEGADVPVSLRVDVGGRLPAASLHVRERLGDGERDVPLERRGDAYAGGYVVEAAPRGHYVGRAGEAVVEDAFGLARREASVPAAEGFVVYPRLVNLDSLFSDSGPGWSDGRRLLLRRPAGFELHTVREYERGDSLRAVHWRSTAKRGELMVKELEDAPRADVAVVLDAHAVPRLGRPPDTPFDAAVRAAGSILRAHVGRGRSARLVVNGTPPTTNFVAGERGWEAALDRLASAEPNGCRDVAGVLDGSATSDARDVTVVTANLSRELAATVLRRASARRRVSVVLVDAASYAGAPTDRADGGRVRLAAAGVPLAVVRRGDDLRSTLAAAAQARTAHG